MGKDLVWGLGERGRRFGSFWVLGPSAVYSQPSRSPSHPQFVPFLWTPYLQMPSQPSVLVSGSWFICQDIDSLLWCFSNT